MTKFLKYMAIAVGVLSFALSSEAFAEDRNFFAGAGLSYAVEDFDDGDLKKFAGGDKIDNAWGFNLFGGYRLLQHLAIEGNFNWYDDFEGKAGAINFDVSIWTLMLDLKVISPALWEDRLFPYLRIGGGYMSAEVDLSGGNDTDDGDFAYDVGLGFDVFVKDHISIGLDGKRVWGNGNVSELNHFVGTLRVGYHF
jgi:opacity protein-like surface antigen